MLLQKAGAWSGQQQRLVQQTRRCPLAVRAAAGQPHTAASISPANSISLSASELSKRIKASSSTVELLQLHAANRDRLDSMHYAALFSKLVQAVEHSSTSTSTKYFSQQQREQQLLPQQQQLYQQQRQPEVQIQQLLQLLLAELPYVINSMQPGPLSAVLRALVKLQVQAGSRLLLALLYRAHRGLGFSAFGPRELCTIAHALVQLHPLDLPWTATATVAQAGVSFAEHAGDHSLQQQGNSSSEQPSSTTTTRASTSSWDPSLVQELFYAIGRSLPRCNAQDAAQALLAVARLRYVPSEAWLQVWLQRATQLLPQFSPQGLANAAYGLVRALQARGEVPSRNTHDWVQANRHAFGADSSSSSSVGRISPQPKQQQLQQSALLAAAHAWLQSCLKVAVLHAQSLKPQELIGQLLWAAGKLGCAPPEPARCHLLTAAEAMLVFCDARHLSAALYAFALLDHRPDAAAARGFWSALSEQVSNLGPRDLDEVLWAAGKLHLQPPAAVREQLQQQALLLLGSKHAQMSAQPAQLALVQGKQGIGQQGPRHVVGVLRGMAKLGWQLQEKYLVRFQGAVLEQLDLCISQDFANMLWALATAGVKVEARVTQVQSATAAAGEEEAAVDVPQHSAVPSRFLDRVLMAAEKDLVNFTPQELSNTLWALSELQHNPSKVWMQELLLASLQQMSQFKPADYSQALGGLAKLGFSPSPLWLNTFWSKSGQSLTQSNFSAAALHSLLLAVVKFGVQPPQKWVQAAGVAVERGLDGFGSQQLLDVLRILQQLSQASTGALHHPAALSSSSSSSSQWTSSMVPVSSSSSNGGAALLRGLQLRVTPNLTVASSSSSIRCAPGIVRLYRQLIATNRVVVMSQGLLRPVWHPATPASIPLPSSSSTSSTSTSLSSLLHHHQQQQQQQLTMSHVDEAYSLACLVMLMPQDLRSRLDHWPQLLAASRAQQLQEQRQQQQQQLGSSRVRQVAATRR